MRTNRNTRVYTPGAVTTHEGAPAAHINAEQQLRRSVMACLLWEKEFYEDGASIAQCLTEGVKAVKPSVVGQIAVQARNDMKLRHAPLFLVREMARYESYRPFVADVLPKVIQRADELAEFMAMYWDGGRAPIAHSVRRGLDKAIRSFNEYELAKYDRDGAVKLRDVFRMIRPHPDNETQSALWKRAVKGELETPDTWEVALSTKDGLTKQEKWTRLLTENKLGALALIRNLRNMEQEKVNEQAVRTALRKMNPKWVLPFRFIAAARFAPRFEPELEAKLFECVADKPKLLGKTCILVDVSSSMDAKLSGKSDMTRVDAGYGMAMVGRELCEDVDVYSFSNQVVLVPPRRGFALRDALHTSQNHGGTELGKAVSYVAGRNEYNRLIVITDEQSHDRVTAPSGIQHLYTINVASARNGVGYGKWTHFDGFSEAIFSYLIESETVKV